MAENRMILSHYAMVHLLNTNSIKLTEEVNFMLHKEFSQKKIFRISIVYVRYQNNFKEQKSNSGKVDENFT